MKNRIMNTGLAVMKCILSSLFLFSLLAFISGCEFDSLNWNNGCCPNLVVDFGSVAAHADSVRPSTNNDSLTLYGHFSPRRLNSKINIVEIGIAIYQDYALVKKITLVKDTVWHFPDINSVVSAKTKIAQPKQNAFTYFTLFYREKNSDGFINLHESNAVTIKEIVPAFTAAHDSVTFPSSKQAILWGHLETKKDCEILSASVIWGYRYNAIYVDTIAVEKYLKANEVLVVRDTVNIEPNTIYEWYIQATAKFANDSLAFIPYIRNEFIKEN